MGLIRDTWRELWQRNRGGGLLTLAFWYTLMMTLYEYLVETRLGPGLPKSLIRFVEHVGTDVAFPHLSTSLWVKLALTYATFMVIILPYAVGGLYGGIASAIRERAQFTGFLAFFRFGYVNFWRALEQILLAFIYVAAVVAALAGLTAGLSALDAQSVALGLLSALIAVALLLWMLGTLLYWFGFTFDTENNARRGWLFALRWSTGRLGMMFAHTVLLVGLFLAAFFAITAIADFVPFIGTILLVLAVGMLFPAYLATYAILLYRTFPAA